MTLRIVLILGVLALLSLLVSHPAAIFSGLTTPGPSDELMQLNQD